MARKRYESPLLLIGLFVLIVLGFAATILDPTGIAGGRGTISYDTMSATNKVMMAVGLTMVLAGVVIRFVAIMQLRRNFSGLLRIREGHTLVKNGIYRYIRHPAYLGAILLFLGVPIMLSSIIGFVVMFLLVPYLAHRITLEERMLVEHFGAEYEEYQRMSKRLIPFVY